MQLMLPTPVTIFNKMFRDTAMGSHYCLHSSWMGEFAFVDNIGITGLMNKNEEHFYFKGDLEMGDEWFFGSFDTEAVYATVVSESATTTHGKADSVIVIELQAKDIDLNNITHAVNGLQFELSQNFGLIKTYDIYNFPNDLTPVTQVGISNPAAGKSLMRYDDIFGFDVGDEFHWEKYEYNSSYSVYTDKDHSTIWKVLSVYNSKQDTLVYQIDQEVYTLLMSLKKDSVIYSHDTVEISYSKSDNSILQAPVYSFNDGDNYNNYYNGVYTSLGIEDEIYIKKLTVSMAMNLGACFIHLVV